MICAPKDIAREKSPEAIADHITLMVQMNRNLLHTAKLIKSLRAVQICRERPLGRSSKSHHIMPSDQRSSCLVNGRSWSNQSQMLPYHRAILIVAPYCWDQSLIKPELQSSRRFKSTNHYIASLGMLMSSPSKRCGRYP